MEIASTFLGHTLAPVKKDLEEICVTQVGERVTLTTLNISISTKSCNIIGSLTIGNQNVAM